MRKLIVPTKRKKTKSKLDQNECKSIAKSEAADELIAPLTWAMTSSLHTSQSWSFWMNSNITKRYSGNA
jgi:hypothetical protein